jgi:hypothetical protein
MVISSDVFVCHGFGGIQHLIVLDYKLGELVVCSSTRTMRRWRHFSYRGAYLINIEAELEIELEPRKYCDAELKL